MDLNYNNICIVLYGKSIVWRLLVELVQNAHTEQEMQ
jgi:hypothetical protein